MPFASETYIRHPESGFLKPPGSWELDHTLAEIALVKKAKDNNADLTDADREQLLKLSGPLIGKALGSPSSLTEEERRRAMGWPSSEECAANIAAVGLDLSPEDFIAKAAIGTGWMTLEQAHLLIHRFNARPLEELVWKPPRDRINAESLIKTDQEARVALAAMRRFRNLNGTDPDAMFRERRKRANEVAQEAAEDLFRRRTEEDLADRRRADEAIAAKTPAWLNEFVKSQRKFGFVVYKTAGLRPLLDEFITAEKQKSGETWTLVPSISSFERLWAYFIDEAIFARNGEIDHMHLYVTGATQFPARLLMSSLTYNFEASAVDGRAYREHFKDGSVKAGASDLSTRYFILVDEKGFPPICDIIGDRTAIYPEAWVYDANWSPPADTDGVRDADGYEGRLRVCDFFYLIPPS